MSVLRPVPLLRSVAAAAVLLLASAAAQAVEFTLLHSFDDTHGSEPFGGVAIDNANHLYGTTVFGGRDNRGVLYRMDGRRFELLHSFHGGRRDGDAGFGTVAVGASGTVYGTTSFGGAADSGTVFEWSPTTGYRLRASFDGAAGGLDPEGGVAVGEDGALYGATLYGGDAACSCGTVFRMDVASGALSTLRRFDGVSGTYPEGVVSQVDGMLYGTWYSGGAGDAGGPFSMQVTGSGLVAYSPVGAAQFRSGLVRDAGGALWGTFRGGDVSSGGIYEVDAAGVFKVVYQFSPPTGYWPTSTLIFGQDGKLYGTTTLGGRRGGGTVFQFDPVTAKLVTVHSFGGPDGWQPHAGVVQDAAGRLYGVTTSGGRFDHGAIFRIAP